MKGVIQEPNADEGLWVAGCGLRVVGFVFRFEPLSQRPTRNSQLVTRNS
jgi:hypothetical protein